MTWLQGKGEFTMEYQAHMPVSGGWGGCGAGLSQAAQRSAARRFERALVHAAGGLRV